MRVREVQRLYDYNYWANEKPEQFTQSVARTYGSIRNTLVHVLSAEWGWLDRHRGQGALLLRTLGRAPGNVDWLMFVGDPDP